MPSDAPLGWVTLRLTFNGEESNAVSVYIVEQSVGLYSFNGIGNGPGAIQNFVRSDMTAASTLLTPVTGNPNSLEVVPVAFLQQPGDTGPLLLPPGP